MHLYSVSVRRVPGSPGRHGERRGGIRAVGGCYRTLIPLSTVPPGGCLRASRRSDKTGLEQLEYWFVAVRLTVRRRTCTVDVSICGTHGRTSRCVVAESLEGFRSFRAHDVTSASWTQNPRNGSGGFVLGGRMELLRMPDFVDGSAWDALERAMAVEPSIMGSRVRPPRTLSACIERGARC
ncbi:hypothetical protein A2348_03790 [Candidatus Uhrbacteria bacterium RIFOXYB12_FULL_58_10]|uniref:Uncharacterized protein n=1 Tax=Candidatus Uhrbacteria bacterium RIFOXYB2_FULL_57_15 TaxID=1802422 RepID=A0A1F7W9C6_9BACT|nr:MAG: hypothetical protein A2348_03790 [Candidatus Uhrbacteria bacterium RIFOXYB12_FULL_58_10]OGL99423.1 MAG: hypothetical protein A2304_01365 [Candidatus Uhrbacteria bacterium RIFOXYB2_FULL_57_15]OGL99866.1 MAG: hypothetical protein A2501_05570 [Candidatus Uhrbacteria bacterium RIFOXYC12_FULL_57_11]